LNKYPWWYDSGATITFAPPQFTLGNPVTQKKERQYSVELFEVIAILSKYPPVEYGHILNRHCQTADGETSVTFDMTTLTRLLVGMSALNVFETGITLHPWYGFPYIPGSSIKGALLHYCNDYEAGGADPAIFGNKKKQGGVIFCDAWPASWSNQQLMTRDIMTPHYGKYYGNNGLPADNDSPNPITILAVKEGVKFRFCLRAKDCSCDLLHKAIALLKRSLTTVGVGAKTGSSYGYFKEA